MTPPRDAQHAPAERWRHGSDAETSDTGAQQVARPVARLRKLGKIGDAEVVAADRFYRDAAFAMGARDGQKTGTGGGQAGFSAAQIDAITRYRQAANALSLDQFWLLLRVVVEEVSIYALAGAAGRPHGRVQAAAAAALKALSAHYAAIDGAKPGSGARMRASTVSLPDTAGMGTVSSENTNA